MATQITGKPDNRAALMSLGVSPTTTVEKFWILRNSRALSAINYRESPNSQPNSRFWEKLSSIRAFFNLAASLPPVFPVKIP